MKFQIFFDESHQLDKHSSKYCYYGILGFEENKISLLNKLFEDRNIKYEIHFSAFKLNKIDDYYEIIKFVLNNAQSNIYMVDCVQALSLGKKIDLSPNNIRKLFYIKLPERLIYGMTRKLSGAKDINITIDKNKKLKISSSKNIEKAEFIYKILSNNKLLDKLYSNDMFIWTLDNKELSKNINKVHISKNISKFLNYKVEYDNRNLRDLMNFHISQVSNGKDFNKREYAQHINLNINNTGSLIDRYLKTLNLY